MSALKEFVYIGRWRSPDGEVYPHVTSVVESNQVRARLVARERLAGEMAAEYRREHKRGDLLPVDYVTLQRVDQLGAVSE